MEVTNLSHSANLFILVVMCQVTGRRKIFSQLYLSIDLSASYIVAHAQDVVDDHAALAGQY